MQNLPSHYLFSQQELDVVDYHLRVLEEGFDGINWICIGFQLLNEFTMENVMVVCFPEKKSNGKGYLKTKQCLRDVTMSNGSNVLIKFIEKIILGDGYTPLYNTSNIHYDLKV